MFSSSRTPPVMLMMALATTVGKMFGSAKEMSFIVKSREVSTRMHSYCPSGHLDQAAQFMVGCCFPNWSQVWHITGYSDSHAEVCICPGGEMPSHLAESQDQTQVLGSVTAWHPRELLNRGQFGGNEDSPGFTSAGRFRVRLSGTFMQVRSPFSGCGPSMRPLPQPEKKVFSAKSMTSFFFILSNWSMLIFWMLCVWLRLMPAM
mmetsp:Transcript_42340/g.100971  ORF Transcript_42340/g.100971 Transcript_42340/m.100971 type:complete len:204 (-) Transcript_42340:1352-1963(-)